LFIWVSFPGILRRFYGAVPCFRASILAGTGRKINPQIPEKPEPKGSASVSFQRGRNFPEKHAQNGVFSCFFCHFFDFLAKIGEL